MLVSTVCTIKGLLQMWPPVQKTMRSATAGRERQLVVTTSRSRHRHDPDPPPAPPAPSRSSAAAFTSSASPQFMHRAPHDGDALLHTGELARIAAPFHNRPMRPAAAPPRCKASARLRFGNHGAEQHRSSSTVRLGKRIALEHHVDPPACARCQSVLASSLHQRISPPRNKVICRRVQQQLLPQPFGPRMMITSRPPQLTPGPTLCWLNDTPTLSSSRGTYREGHTEGVSFFNLSNTGKRTKAWRFYVLLC